MQHPQLGGEPTHASGRGPDGPMTFVFPPNYSEVVATSPAAIPEAKQATFPQILRILLQRSHLPTGHLSCIIDTVRQGTGGTVWSSFSLASTPSIGILNTFQLVQHRGLLDYGAQKTILRHRAALRCRLCSLLVISRGLEFLRQNPKTQKYDSS